MTSMFVSFSVCPSVCLSVQTSIFSAHAACRRHNAVNAVIVTSQ